MMQFYRDLFCWPVMKIGDIWTPEDAILLGCWEDMVKSGTARGVFYQGRVKTGQEWLDWVHNPDNLTVLVCNMRTKTVVGAAWLNHLVDGTAYAHFASTRGYKRGGGEAVMSYWSTFKHEDGTPVFKTIIGVTPETYRSVHRCMERWGFTLLGVIPNLCNLLYEGVRVGGMIGYYCPKQEVSNG